MKAKTLVGLPAERFGVRAAGWEALALASSVLADVDSAAPLAHCLGAAAGPGQARIEPSFAGASCVAG